MSKQKKQIAEGFALNLLLLRSKAGLTQAELGDQIGLPQSRISNLERGRALPQLDQFIRLTEVLGARPNQLLKGVIS